jgi:trans-2,3-dihydro-3-hydroxyanthranilate isomerase
MKLDFFTYDVFTNRRFGGNPLAIVTDADHLSTEQMQTIAREFNLSETIFVMKPADPANTAKVRIFLPAAEIPFAGHPTVGCAVFLAERKYKTGCSFETEIRLEENAGLVPVKVSRIGGVPRAIFTAPVLPSIAAVQTPAAADAARALGLEPGDIGWGGHAPRVIDAGPRGLLIPLGSREALARARAMEPHWSAMLSPLATFFGYLYTPGGDDPRTNYRARMFAPATGVPEDPATGGATVMLAAQLLSSESLADGAYRWQLEQGYEMGRPSDLTLEADVAGGRLIAVRVAGQAVQFMSGVLEL